MPSHRSDPRLLVLHGLRIKGTAEAASVAAAVGLPAVQVARLLDQLAAAGLVARTDGLLTGWSLTRAGRAEHSRALRAELEGLAARPTVEAAYRRFLDMNPGVLDACSRWQVRERRGRPVRNDHDDHRYDERVLRELDGALAGVRPTSDRLASVLDRFSAYAPQLETALGRARAGETDYVTKPVIPSFHTVWFEMHEDLLVTLDIDRSSEESRTRGSTSGPGSSRPRRAR